MKKGMDEDSTIVENPIAGMHVLLICEMITLYDSVDFETATVELFIYPAICHQSSSACVRLLGKSLLPYRNTWKSRNRYR